MHPPPPPPSHNHLFPYAPPNPNPNLFFQQPPPPPAQFPPTATSTTTTQSHHLSTALSSLTHLLTLSDRTLNSLSALPKPQNPNLVPSPYNPTSLHYSKTLNPLPKTLFSNNNDRDRDRDNYKNGNSEIFFSLDSYFNEFSSSNNFFYKDCPGVVNLNNLDSSKRVFRLPSVLSVECVDCGEKENAKMGFCGNGFSVLPSDLWHIRKEVEGWVDYPSVCSFGVVCAISGLNLVKLSDLKKWVFADSPRYGVVSDVYLKDHISVLFRLSLKAIRREALGFAGSEMDVRSLSFECPVLVQVLMWVVSQLSVLYGEVNAKWFAIHIFKQCLLEAAKEVLLFPLEFNCKGSSDDLDANGSDDRAVKLHATSGGSTDCELIQGANNSIEGDVIFVSQVAAAVAALHERSLLEAKIKGLWVSHVPPRNQRMAEHTYVSKIADEERKNRPNYKAIIEHDSLLRKRSSDQDASKTKTKEELLAEERDYKRRRMSYRGKKAKRTKLEVMRDIIDEYMEEIKQAGRIGYFEKGDEEESTFPKPSSVPDANDLGKNNADSFGAIKASPDPSKRKSQSMHEIKSTNIKDTVPRNQDAHRQRRSISQDRNDGDYYSRSPERRGSHGQSREHGSHRREQDDRKATRTKRHENRSSSKSSYHDYKSSYSQSDSANKFSARKDEHISDVRHRHLRNSYGSRGSNLSSQYAFDDRFDPTESRDMHEDDVYTGSKYLEKFHE